MQFWAFKSFFWCRKYTPLCEKGIKENDIIQWRLLLQCNVAVKTIFGISPKYVNQYASHSVLLLLLHGINIIRITKIVNNWIFSSRNLSSKNVQYSLGLVNLSKILWFSCYVFLPMVLEAVLDASRQKMNAVPYLNRKYWLRFLFLW